MYPIKCWSSFVRFGAGGCSGHIPLVLHNNIQNNDSFNALICGIALYFN